MRTFGPSILPHLRSSGRMSKVGQFEPLDLVQESRWPLDRVRCLELSLWSMRRRNRSRPLDLGPNTCQPLDWTGKCLFGLASPRFVWTVHLFGICQKSAESRDIGTREIGILEVVRTETSQVSKSRRGSGPSVGRGHVVEIKRHRRLAHREIGISMDKRSGKS
jgi:hypothetical protein